MVHSLLGGGLTCSFSVTTVTPFRTSKWEASVWHRELSSVFCDDLDGWMGVGKRGGSRERGYMYPCNWFTLLYSGN